MAVLAGRSLALGELFDQLSQGKKLVILCATHRLAHNLRLGFGQGQIAAGAARWPTPQATGVDAWLEQIGEQIALQGEVPLAMVPDRVLSAYQEGLVWQQAIVAVGGDDPALALFDVQGLARTAAEAQALIDTWQLPVDGDGGSEETRQFLRWRRRFGELCKKNGWVDQSEYQSRIMTWLARGAGRLPECVVFAGFDAVSPHLERLRAVLAGRGVDIAIADFRGTPAGIQRTVACDDAETECRAAAAWAQDILRTRPDARIGIVVADLEARRAIIAPILEEILEPAGRLAGDDASPRQYNLSLGLPLSRHAMVDTALALLRLLAQRQGLALTEFGDLLRQPYWSADQDEADLRAQMDARLRQGPSRSLSVEAAGRLAKSLAGDGRLVQHLGLLAQAQQSLAKARKPGAWAAAFEEILDRVGWPGQRALSSSEFQVRSSFLEVLAQFGELDAFLGSIGIAAATAELARQCREKLFQPQTLGQPPLQVLGLIEAKGAQFDALWVMGMNDQHWPPPARPNPLLSAEQQRRQRTPGASAEVQGEFARAIQQRLLHSAPDITFSYAQKEGERELRPSPLIDGVGLARRCSRQEAAPPAEPGLAHQAPGACELVDDHLAPPLAPGETVSGGSGLLKAQAICPAWAFYRYRLAAAKLETPSEGLDASSRGTLVHATLEALWTALGAASALRALSAEELQRAIGEAVAQALQRFEGELGEPLAPTFRRLEAQRLQRLAAQWLAVERVPEEAGGRAAFRVLACEQEHAVDLGPLRINLVIDRIDELVGDGRRIVLDYKTGSQVDARGWQDERLHEPQLPLYAAVVLAGADQPQVAAVALAKVRLGQCGFTGVAAEDRLLPGVRGLRESAAVATGAPDPWQHLLGLWRQRLAAIAAEIQRGEAAVRFVDAKDLAYCDVLPLLRVTERQQQFEQAETRP